ncbi:MAG: hypothetical protein LC437_06045, partial [Thiohalomonas sp.]|nr:hypothetical protein [Thiohalomonas sp.]
MGCESNLRHWIILIFFSMKIKHFYRSWVYTPKFTLNRVHPLIAILSECSRRKEHPYRKNQPILQ